jgi:hypothetical protein
MQVAGEIRRGSLLGRRGPAKQLSHSRAIAGTLRRVRAADQSRLSDTRVRGALLMPLCALAVHQLRYYVAYGSGASRQLERQGHTYLTAIEPFLLLAAALAIGTFLGAISRRAASSNRERSTTRLWAICALTLIAIFCFQELFEGAFVAGHPAGLAGMIGHGGWLAVPAAIAVGGLLALALRVAERLIARIATRAQDRVRSDRPQFSRAPASDWRLVPLSGLSAGRAPPQLA